MAIAKHFFFSPFVLLHIVIENSHEKQLNSQSMEVDTITIQFMEWLFVTKTYIFKILYKQSHASTFRLGVPTPCVGSPVVMDSGSHSHVKPVIVRFLFLSQAEKREHFFVQWGQHSKRHDSCLCCLDKLA